MKFENTQAMNFENAFRGLRNPLESWKKSDSEFGIANIENLLDFDIAKYLAASDLYLNLDCSNNNTNMFLQARIFGIPLISIEDFINKSYLEMNIDSVTSGKETLEAIKKKKYDVILLDIMMPDMDGIETLKELKKIEGFNTPVVALTADAISGAKEKYLKEGFTSYIAKPFTRDQIKEKLDKVFQSNE